MRDMLTKIIDALTLIDSAVNPEEPEEPEVTPVVESVPETRSSKKKGGTTK